MRSAKSAAPVDFGASADRGVDEDQHCRRPPSREPMRSGTAARVARRSLIAASRARRHCRVAPGRSPPTVDAARRWHRVRPRTHRGACGCFCRCGRRRTCRRAASRIPSPDTGMVLPLRAGDGDPAGLQSRRESLQPRYMPFDIGAESGGGGKPAVGDSDGKAYGLSADMAPDGSGYWIRVGKRARRRSTPACLPPSSARARR